MKDYSKIINEAYTEIYQAASPSVDFKTLVNDLLAIGATQFPFYNYRIDESVYDDIVARVAKKYKLTKWETVRLKISLFDKSPIFNTHENNM